MSAMNFVPWRNARVAAAAGPGSALLLDDGAAELLKWCGGWAFAARELNVATVQRMHDFQAQPLRTQGSTGSTGSTGGAAPHRGASTLIVVTTTHAYEWFDAIVTAAHEMQVSRVLVCTSFDAFTTQATTTEDQVSHRLAAFIASLGMRVESVMGAAKGGSGGEGSTFEAFSEAVREGVGALSRTQGGDGDVASLTVETVCTNAHVVAPMQSVKSTGRSNDGDDNGFTWFVAATKASQCVRPVLPWEVTGAKKDLKTLAVQDIPPTTAQSLKLLALQLAATIVHQLHCDVEGRAFAIGGTSTLIGNRTATRVSELISDVRFSPERGLNQPPPTFEEAALVVIDRTVLLADAARHGGTMAHRIMSVLPRSTVRTGTDAHDETAAPFIPTDVGVAVPQVPGAARIDPFSSSLRDGDELSDALTAGKLLASLPGYVPPPTLCHTADERGQRLVEALLYLDEEEAGLHVITELAKELHRLGAPPVPKKKRTLGPELYAHLHMLLKTLQTKSQLETLPLVSLLQITGCMVEALQRTSPKLGGTWDLLASAEARHREMLRSTRPELVSTQLQHTLRDDELEKLSVREIFVLLLHVGGTHEWDASTRDWVLNTVLQLLDRRIDARDPGLVRDVETWASEASVSQVREFVEVGGGRDADGGAAAAAALKTQLRDEVAGIVGKLAMLSATFRLSRDSAEAGDEVASGTEDLGDAVAGLLDPEGPRIRGLKKVGGALQQMGRAGLGLVTKGMNLFGVQAPQFKDPHPGESHKVIVFVVGGITMSEVKAVRNMMERDPVASGKQVMLGSNRVIDPDDALGMLVL